MRQLATIAAALMLAVPNAGAQKPVDAPTFDWTDSLAPGATVRLDVPDGNLRVTASPDNHLTVHGQRHHGSLLFQAVTDGNNVTICAFRHGSQCAIDGVHGHFHIPMPFSIHTASADLTVALPPGAILVAHTSDGTIDVRGAGAGVTAENGDGDIRIAGSSGAVHAHTSDGRIHVDTIAGSVYARSGDGPVVVADATGSVEASTADGNVEVRLAAVDTAQRVKVHTGDGPVTVYLPASFTGDVDARTSDGKIVSELPLPVSGRLDPQHIRATVGTNGGTQLVIDASGDIHLKKF
jgi:hypothetical protein